MSTSLDETSAEARWVDYLPLDEIREAPRNAKRHDETGIANSVDRFGIGELPLLDERTGRLVAGHGRLDDLRKRRRRGDPPPKGVRVENGVWLAPVLRGWASVDDSDADAYAIASNKLTETGGWDTKQLAQIVTDLARVDESLATVTGIPPADLDALLRAGDYHSQKAISFLANDLQTPPAGLVEHPEAATTGSLAGGGAHIDYDPSEGDAQEPAEGAAAPAQGGDWVTVTWVATKEQRAIIRNAIARRHEAVAEQHEGAARETDIQALVAICHGFLGEY